ncbi:MAG: hypothetical protein QNI96_05400 [Woeseiaceae bacterium]|nr:hypothetical protein [Woeseiaceae bacterium]
MAGDDTARELERLRADVAALQDARRENKKQAQEAPPEDTPAAAASTEAPEAPAVEATALPEEQKTQLEELGDLLQQEIRDLPTITCLTVFSLGILMGRLLR